MIDESLSVTQSDNITPILKCHRTFYSFNSFVSLLDHINIIANITNIYFNLIP